VTASGLYQGHASDLGADRSGGVSERFFPGRRAGGVGNSCRMCGLTR